MSTQSDENDELLLAAIRAARDCDGPPSRPFGNGAEEEISVRKIRLDESDVSLVGIHAAEPGLTHFEIERHIQQNPLVKDTHF